MTRLAVSLIVVFVAAGMTARGDDEKSTDKYLLRYKLQAGETIRYEVTHVAKTKTRIRGAEEVSQVHTVSQRHWDVKSAADTTMSFAHVIDAVQMTQQQGDAAEVRWDSTSETDPPVVFERVAEQIGETLSTITINARGQEKDREDHGGTKASLGMGSLTLAFPDEPIGVGEFLVPFLARSRPAWKTAKSK